MKKKLLAVLLGICMTATMFGCSNKKTDTSSTDTNAAVTEAAGASDAESTENTEDLAFGKYENAVTISTVTSEYASAKYPEGDDITSNVWTRAYKDKFNIDVVTNWVSDEYDTKLNLDISSGTLPDVFHCSAAQLQQLIEADMIWDLTDIYNQYASDRVKGYMEADAASFESGKVDGKLYGIPQMHWGLIDQPDYIWIRNDWKEECGLADPTSMDDVVNIAKTFTDKYGVYGLAVDQTLDYLNLTAVAWHAHPDMWIKGDDGSIAYGSVQTEMKTALAAWADWYSQGIINKDFATQDFNAMQSDIVSSKAGIQPFYQWWGYNPGVDEVTNNGVDAIFYPYDMPSADGQEVTQSIFFANSSYTVVSKSCKNPEAALKLINFYGYMIDDSTGKEDAATISSFTDNDLAHVVGAFRVLNPDCDYNQYVNVSKALLDGDTSTFTTSGMWQKYNNSVEFKKNGTPGSTGDYLQQGAEKCAYGLAKNILDNNKYIKSALWGATPEQLLNYGTTLDDLLTEGFTKIIMGEESIDYFDTVVQDWKAAGGEEATQAMNDKYGN